MAIVERGGYKVDLATIKNMAVESCLFIESWSKSGKGENPYNKDRVHFTRPKKSAHTPSVKAKYHNRLATKIKNELFDDKRKKISNKLALSTYTSYLGDVREAIQLETNIKSPTLISDMRKLKEKYPMFSKSFNAISRASAKNIKDVKSREMDIILLNDSLISDDAHNELASINVHHLLINLLAPTKAQSTKRKKRINANRDKRKNNATTLNYTHIISVIEGGLNSDDFNELALGIALSTGRRAIEVMHVGDFKKSRGKNDISFAGVAKKFSTGAAHKRHTIPTLFDASRIVNAVKKLRKTKTYQSLINDVSELPKKQQNIVINRRVAGGLNKIIRVLFRDKSLVFKDSRTIAGNIAVEKIATQKRYNKLDRGAFRTMYFIHDTFEEAVNYEHIKIDFKGTYTPTNEADKPSATGIIDNADISAFESITGDLMNIDKKGMKVVMKLHHKLIDKLSSKGGFALSVSSIYKGKKNGDELIRIGSNRAVVKRYMELTIVKKAVAEYHKANGLKTKR
jgi:hypothetical protein